MSLPKTSNGPEGENAREHDIEDTSSAAAGSENADPRSIERSPRRKIRGKFVVSFGEQCLGSAITLGINLWLIRNDAAMDYGVFAFWLTVAWLAGTLQGAMVIAHLYRLPPHATRAGEHRAMERLLLRVGFGLLALVVVAVTAASLALPAARTSTHTFSAGLFVGAFLFYQLVRALAFSRHRADVAFLLTGGAFAVIVALVALSAVNRVPPTAALALQVSAIGYGGVAAATFFALSSRGDAMPLDYRRYQPILRSSGWLILGAVSNEMVGRLYTFAAAERFGLDALALLSAVQVTTRPAYMVATAWSAIGWPALSARVHAGDSPGYRRLLRTGIGITGTAALMFSVAVVVGWGLVSSLVYKGRYPEAGILPILFGVSACLGCIATVLNVACLAKGAYKRLALIDLAGAAATACCLLAANGSELRTLVYATIAGQVTQIAWMLPFTLGSRHLSTCPAET